MRAASCAFTPISGSIVGGPWASGSESTHGGA